MDKGDLHAQLANIEAHERSVGPTLLRVAQLASSLQPSHLLRTDRPRSICWLCSIRHWTSLAVRSSSRISRSQCRRRSAPRLVIALWVPRNRPPCDSLAPPLSHRCRQKARRRGCRCTSPRPWLGGLQRLGHSMRCSASCPRSRRPVACAVWAVLSLSVRRAHLAAQVPKRLASHPPPPPNSACIR